MILENSLQHFFQYFFHELVQLLFFLLDCPVGTIKTKNTLFKHQRTVFKLKRQKGDILCLVFGL